MFSSKDYLQELSTSQLQEEWENHDCHLSRDGGCEVCTEYFNRKQEQLEMEVCEDCGGIIDDNGCACPEYDHRPRPEQVYPLINY